LTRAVLQGEERRSVVGILSGYRELEADVAGDWSLKPMDISH